MKKLKLALRLILSIIIFASIAISCSNKQNHNTLEVPKQIVITFDSIKNNYDTLYFKSGTSVITSQSVLTTKLSSNKREDLELKRFIEINPDTDFVVVSHKYCPTSSIDFILQEGDTANIQYVEDGVPLIKLKNRDVKKYDLNFDYFRRKRYALYEDMQISEIVNDPSIYFYKKTIKGEKISNKKIFQDFIPKYITELEDENVWLDSIFSSNLISKKDYQFYKNRNKYTLLQLVLKDKDPHQLDSLIKNYNDSVYTNDINGYYRKYYFYVAANYLNSIPASIKGNESTSVYDYIDNQKDITGKLSEELRESMLIKIFKNSPLESRLKYFDKFSKTISDTTIINRIRKNYGNLLNPDIANKDKLILLNPDGEKSTFAEILNQHKGKKVYVDFWASWCAPCLIEMPISKELRELKELKGIVFIYLSIDDKEDQWRKIWSKAYLDKYNYNFLILNSRDASFLKEYKLSSIPRYMIFDESGELIDSDAPQPSDKEIKKILTNK